MNHARRGIVVALTVFTFTVFGMSCGMGSTSSSGAKRSGVENSGAEAGANDPGTLGCEGALWAEYEAGRITLEQYKEQASRCPAPPISEQDRCLMRLKERVANGSLSQEAYERALVDECNIVPPTPAEIRAACIEALESKLRHGGATREEVDRWIAEQCPPAP